ncbi:MAG: acetylxylan esterase [Chloroflexi bacterium]|mgnify:CR=1 FL=1|nr:acetylxylan esterase [Chloroflexota bacterium]
MTSKVLSPREIPELQPSSPLWALYQPDKAPLRFAAASADEARDWQARAREALLDAIGFQSLPVVPAEPQTLEQVDKGDYVREKILIRTSPWTVMPVYILKPKTVPEPAPAVVAFHGHGYGVKDIVGLWEDGEERDTPDGYHLDFGVALCRRGFIVAAPEISCFGERLGDFSHLKPEIGQEIPYTCHHTATLAFYLGGSAVGLRVWDGLRLVDYLETRGDVDMQRLGAMGISGGGMHTFYSTAVDLRIKACVVSGYFCTYKYSILNMHHCTCNYVPGLHRFGEIYDLAGLIAPRPMLVEAGTRDPIFPIEGVKEAVDRARNVYGVFDSSDKLETDIFEGRHQIHGKRAYDFLWDCLAGPKTA